MKLIISEEMKYNNWHNPMMTDDELDEIQNVFLHFVNTLNNYSIEFFEDVQQSHASITILPQEVSLGEFYLNDLIYNLLNVLFILDFHSIIKEGREILCVKSLGQGLHY